LETMPLAELCGCGNISASTPRSTHHGKHHATTGHRCPSFSTHAYNYLTTMNAAPRHHPETAGSGGFETDCLQAMKQH
jgi:hypothetical protein